MKLTTLFCDVGGVLLSNGWGHQSRKLAAEKFGYDFAEAETRHHLMFDDYEEGKISPQEYLHFTIFNQPHSFSVEAYEAFMYVQSQPLQPMLDYVKELKRKHALKIVLVSNEGRELTQYRVEKFNLKEVANIFVVSSFVGVRKPSKAIFHLALDLAQVQPEEVLYLDDRLLFVEVAQSLGIPALHHIDKPTTETQLKKML